jgi:predicted SprT family Zn-dependent metalloprotease
MFNNLSLSLQLDKDMSITWNNRLTSTAGFCYNQRKKIAEDETIRTSRIELSGKVNKKNILSKIILIGLFTQILTNCADLRDTLIHEMCHAATWVIDGTLGGHGPVWKKWSVFIEVIRHSFILNEIFCRTAKAKRVHRALPEIKRCHSFNVETKYTYKCTVCFYR